jgi:GNAT superfamily N-acetyltransferase
MAERLDKDPISMRQMTIADIGLGMKLKSFAGWNQVEADWEMFLNAGGSNFVANLDGKDVGTVTAVPYSNHFTWIGMVLVDPSARRKGIGSGLLRKSIEESIQAGPVRLDATADGYELYKTLGFSEEYKLIRMTRRSNSLDELKFNPCDQTRICDIASMINYDSPVFGADRSFILKALYQRNPEYAMCCSRAGNIEGYCMGRSGCSFEQIGPVVAENEATAKDLLLTAMIKCQGSDVVVDAFADKPEWIRFLEEIGFTRQRTFIRMCLGDLKYPGITRKQFTIAGPEIG